MIALYACGAHLGDIIMLMPCIQALGSFVVVVVDDYVLEHLDFLSIFPHEAIFISRDNFIINEYQTIYDLSTGAYAQEKYLKSVSAHRTDIYASIIGLKLKSYKPKTNFVSTARQELSLFIDQGSKDFKRRLPESKLIELIQHFKDTYTTIYVNAWFTKQFQLPDNIIVISDYNDIDKMNCLLNSNKFIGPDSLFMHLAGSLEIEGIGILGPFDKKDRLKYYKTIKPYNRKIDCFKCRHDVCNNGFKCMQANIDNIAKLL